MNNFVALFVKDKTYLLRGDQRIAAKFLIGFYNHLQECDNLSDEGFLRELEIFGGNALRVVDDFSEAGYIAFKISPETILFYEENEFGGFKFKKDLSNTELLESEFLG
jgi:hypothetical protein